MKILLILHSSFFTNEQNNELYDSMIEIDWDLPFIPRDGDCFDVTSIVGKEKLPDFFDTDLAFSVDYVVYKKINNVVTPIIWVIGE